MSFNDAVDTAHAAITALKEHKDELKDIAERKAGAQTLLDQTTRDLATHQDRLKQVRAELTQVEGALTSKTHIVDDERARALKEYNDQIASARGELDRVNLQIKNLEARHDELIASMESLRKRLLG